MFAYQASVMAVDGGCMIARPYSPVGPTDSNAHVQFIGKFGTFAECEAACKHSKDQNCARHTHTRTHTHARTRTRAHSACAHARTRT